MTTRKATAKANTGILRFAQNDEANAGIPIRLRSGQALDCALALDVGDRRICKEANGDLRKSLMELEAKLVLELRSTGVECVAGAEEGNFRCGCAFALAVGSACPGKERLIHVRVKH